MIYARLHETRIVELFYKPIEELRNLYHKDFLATLVQVPGDAKPNQFFYDGQLHDDPKIDFVEYRTHLQEMIQEKKNKKRDGGFLVDGVLFDSDSAANVAYLNFYTKITQNPSYSTMWKASKGCWVLMDAAKFAEVYAAFESNNTAAYAWQAQMDGTLAAAPDTKEALQEIEEMIKEA